MDRGIDATDNEQKQETVNVLKYQKNMIEKFRLYKKLMNSNKNVDVKFLT